MGQLTTRCRRQSAAPAADGHHVQENFGFWHGAAFTVNYIMGCGFLGIPEAFVKSGLALGPVFVAVFCVLMNITKDYVCEAVGRAEAIASAAAITRRQLQERGKGDASTTSTSSSGGGGATLSPARDDYLVHVARKFELTDMFAMFIGPKARLAYVVVLCGYMYGALWAYSSVFAASFSANVPVVFLNGGSTCNIEDSDGSCSGPFHLWLGVFAVIAIPLACMELTEQVAVQVVMFIARILVVLLLTGTVLGGMGCSQGVSFAELPPGHTGDAPLVNAAGLSTLIPVSIYAFIFHHSVPVLAQPLVNKRGMRAVFAMAFVITGVAYVAIGGIVAWYFGSRVDSQCNLNWRNYVGCMAPPPQFAVGLGDLAAAPGGEVAAPFVGGAYACANASTWDASCVDVGSRPTYASVIAFVVLIFPALDVLSAFPLNAITLGNNLMSACLGETALSPPTPEEEAAFCAAHGLPLASGASSSKGAEEETASLIAGEQPSQATGSDGSSGSVARSASLQPLQLAASDAGAAAGGGAPAPPAGALHIHAPREPGAARGAGASAGDRPWYLATRRRHRLTTVAFRLLAAVPPVIGAAFVSDLGNILQFTGTIGVAIAFTVPAILQLSSFAKTRAVYVFLSTAVPAAGLVAAGGGHAQSALEAGVAGASRADATTPLVGSAGLASCAGAHAAGVAALANSLPSPAGGGADAAADPLWSPMPTPVSAGATAAAAAPAGAGGVAPAAEDAQHLLQLVHAAKHSTHPGWREMLLQRTAVDALFWDTPYTTWFVRWRLPLAIFAASFAVAAFVLVDVSLQVANGSS